MAFKVIVIRQVSIALWQDRVVLQSVEIRAVLAVPESPFHNLHWSGRLELSIDCFVCQRTGRTTLFEVGAEQAVCSGTRSAGKHHAAGRISAFDQTGERDRTSLRAVVDYWWAPFHDAKHDVAATLLTRGAWVRHHLSYYCPEHRVSGVFSDQTNIVRPAPVSCEHCSTVIAERREAPCVRLLA